jgi:hypothetical protein
MPVTDPQIAGQGLQFQKKQSHRIVYRWENKTSKLDRPTSGLLEEKK